MEESSFFFDALLKAQKEFMNNWLSAGANMQKVFSPGASGQNANPHDVLGMYNTWLKTVGGSFDEMMKMYPAGVGKDTVSKLFRGFDSYMKFYDFWLPVIKAIQENTFDPENYKDLLDSSKYKELLDKMLGFSGPDSAKEFFGNASGMIETWGAAAQNFVHPWMDSLQKNFNIVLDASSAADPNASMNLFHNLYGAFEKTFGKVFKTPQVGKDREKMELLLRTMDLYSVYIAKNAEFQHKMYVAGEAAMRKVVESLAQKIKAGEEIKGYNDFYKIWADINEAEYFELFNTEEFSVVQGSLLESALEFRKQYHKLIEMNLSDLPIPVRSEMDDVYKTIYDLKKRLRALEKNANIKTVIVKEGE
ncbi:MAG: hypothetical protein HQK92_11940 [Nitrospirae bacterium]|nr:hypothetical protein [Nitrospirota bacterium]